MVKYVISWRGNDNIPKSRVIETEIANDKTGKISLDLENGKEVNLYPILKQHEFDENYNSPQQKGIITRENDQSYIQIISKNRNPDLLSAMQRKIPDANKYLQVYNQRIADKIWSEVSSAELITTVGNIVNSQSIELDTEKRCVITPDMIVYHHLRYTSFGKLIVEMDHKKFYFEVQIQIIEVGNNMEIELVPLKFSYPPSSILETHNFDKKIPISTSIKHLLRGITYWFHAVRSHQFIITLMSIMIGIGLSISINSFDVTDALLIIIGTYAVQSGGNLLNDYFDHQSKLDEINLQYTINKSNKFIQNRLLDPIQALSVGIFLFTIGSIIGLYLNIITSGNIILILGIIGGITTYFYAGEPIKLVYRGIGEVLLAMNFGPFIIIGTYYVMTDSLIPRDQLLFIVVPSLLFITALFILNGLADIEVDQLVNKTTTSVRLGRSKSLILLIVVISSSLIIFAIGTFTGRLEEFSIISWLIMILSWLMSLVELIRLQIDQQDKPNMTRFVIGYIGFSIMLFLHYGFS